MATINPSDTTVNLILETSEGVTPATPAWTVFDYIAGNMPEFTADVIQSNVQQANRASAGSRKSAFKVGGSLKTQFRIGAHLDLLLQSALSGTLTAGVIKAGTTDKSFSIETIFKAGADKLYRRYTGCQASDMTLSVDASSNAEVSFNLIGMGFDSGTAILTGATYVPPAASTYYAGLDVNDVSVEGLDVTYRALELTVSHSREAQDQFGQASARGIGTSGNRTVSLKLTFYREDLSPDTLLALSDDKVAVGFKIGGEGNGYQFDLPACNYNVPADSVDNSKQLVEVTFTGAYDDTAGTDLVITKI